MWSPLPSPENKKKTQTVATSRPGSLPASPVLLRNCPDAVVLNDGIAIMPPPRPSLEQVVFKTLQSVVCTEMGLPPPPQQRDGGGQNDQVEGGRVRRSALSGKIVDPSRRLLSQNETQRALRQFRFDRYDDLELRGHKRIPLKALGDFVGLSRWVIHPIIWTGKMSRRTQELLSPAIISIMEGKLRFRRYGQHWKPEGEAARFMYEDPRWRRRSQVWSSRRNKR
jgi:hypothetical protein